MMTLLLPTMTVGRAIQAWLVLWGLVGLVSSIPHTSHFTLPGVRPPRQAAADFIPKKLSPETCPQDFKEHPLILISMDGFRADFIDRGLTPTLAKMAKRGVYAPYMKPSYPTITFPNHYSIVTGMVPPAHGIVANRFWDPVFNATFKPGSPESLQRRFWGGEPVWKTVEKQGQIAATYFWPGSEVVGNTPTYWFPFSKLTPFNVRVNQVLAWLDLPPHQRPRFITLYMHEPDAKGHKFGPDSPQVNEALRLVDDTVRMLVAGLNRRGLLSCVNLLVVADHGLTQAGPEKVLKLNNIVPNFSNKATSIWNGVFGRFNAKDRSYEGTVSLMKELSCKRRPLTVYHRQYAPVRWHLGGQRRIEDIVVDLANGYQVDGDGTYVPDMGDHGFDNYIADMNALFLAHGPAFQRGLEVEAFQNTELYNLMCLLTDSRPAPNNGTWGALHHLLVNPPQEDDSEKIFLLPPVAFLSKDPEDLEERLEDSECQSDSDGGEDPSKTLRSLSKAQSLGLRSLGFWHAPWGLPNVAREDMPGVLLLTQQTHVTAYSRALRVPLWTSFFLDGAAKTKRTSKEPRWLPDPRIHDSDTAPVCATLAQLRQTDTMWRPLYRPDFESTSRRGSVNQLTTNALVMTHTLSRAWDSLAATINRWRRTYGSMQVVAGPVFDSDGDTIKDDYNKWQVRDGGVAVPTHLFVVITRCHLGFGGLHSCPPNRLDTLAFILPQHLPVSNCLSPMDYLQEFSAKVKDVETITGLQLLAALPDRDRIRQQIRIHSNIWGREIWSNRLRSDFFGLKR